MVFYATILNCNRFIISGGKDDGITRACRWFRSDRHHATRWHLDPCHGERPRLQPARNQRPSGANHHSAGKLGPQEDRRPFLQRGAGCRPEGETPPSPSQKRAQGRLFRLCRLWQIHCRKAATSGAWRAATRQALGGGGESPGGCEIPAQRQDPAQRGRRRNPDRVGARSREGRRPGRARPDHGFAAEPAARTRYRSNRSGPGRHQAGRGEDP